MPAQRMPALAAFALHIVAMEDHDVHLSTTPRSLMLMLLVAVVASAPACRAVEGIFKAGFWVGALLAVAAVAVIVFIANRLGS